MASIRTINLEDADSLMYRSRDRMLEVARPDYAEYARLPNSSFVIDKRTKSIRFKSGASTTLILEFGSRTAAFTALAREIAGSGFDHLEF